MLEVYCVYKSSTINLEKKSIHNILDSFQPITHSQHPMMIELIHKGNKQIVNSNFESILEVLVRILQQTNRNMKNISSHPS